MAKAKAKNDATTDGIGRTDYNLKKGQEVPEHLDGLVLKIRTIKPTDDADEAMRRMLAVSENVQAVIDTFNGQGFHLNQQKAAKAYTKEEWKDATLEGAQAVADGFKNEPNKRGRGGSSKTAKARNQGKREATEALLADLDEEQRAILEERAKKLGLI